MKTAIKNGKKLNILKKMTRKKSAKIDVHWGDVKMLKKCTFSVIFANMNCSIQGTLNCYNSAKS